MLSYKLVSIQKRMLGRYKTPEKYLNILNDHILYKMRTVKQRSIMNWD